jgi:MoaA/NifB/PqqE/SkfB family radical SAM enzyme
MSNIFSNGDVVPCCYDYDSELKVGNAFERPFSQIWNSLAYQELRKKIHLEKDAILKCKECGINFKLSQAGWFVETHEFNPDITQRVKMCMKQVKRFAGSLAKKRRLCRINQPIF